MSELERAAVVDEPRGSRLSSPIKRSYRQNSSSGDEISPRKQRRPSPQTHSRLGGEGADSLGLAMSLEQDRDLGSAIPLDKDIATAATPPSRQQKSLTRVISATPPSEDDLGIIEREFTNHYRLATVGRGSKSSTMNEPRTPYEVNSANDPDNGSIISDPNGDVVESHDALLQFFKASNGRKRSRSNGDMPKVTNKETTANQKPLSEYSQRQCDKCQIWHPIHWFLTRGRSWDNLTQKCIRCNALNSIMKRTNQKGSFDSEQSMLSTFDLAADEYFKAWSDWVADRGGEPVSKAELDPLARDAKAEIRRLPPEDRQMKRPSPKVTKSTGSKLDGASSTSKSAKGFHKFCTTCNQKCPSYYFFRTRNAPDPHGRCIECRAPATCASHVKQKFAKDLSAEELKLAIDDWCQKWERYVLQTSGNKVGSVLSQRLRSNIFSEITLGEHSDKANSNTLKPKSKGSETQEKQQTRTKSPGIVGLAMRSDNGTDTARGYSSKSSSRGKTQYQGTGTDMVMECSREDVLGWVDDIFRSEEILSKAMFDKFMARAKGPLSELQILSSKIRETERMLE